MRCADCRFYEPSQAPSDGECRRRSPRHQDGPPWPRIGPEKWCGEYQPSGDVLADAEDRKARSEERRGIRAEIEQVRGRMRRQGPLPELAGELQRLLADLKGRP